MYKYTPKTFCGFACVIFIFLVSLSFTGCDNSKIITSTTKIDSLEWRAIAEIQEWWSGVMDDEEQKLEHRIKCSELLAKSQGGFIDRIEADINTETTITIELSDD